MTERGRILRDTNAGAGLVTVNGKQYAFALEDMWRSDVPPRVGMFADVTFNSAGAIEALYAVSDAQVAKEQAHKALSGALEGSKAMRGGLLKSFGIATVIAEALLLLAFFLLPNFTIGPAVMQRALSGWDATGLNTATMMTNDHGLLSLLALVCLFAPVAVPFLRQSWARWLYAAPLLFGVLNLFSLLAGAGKQSREAASAIGDAFGAEAASAVTHMNTPSLAVGTYVVLLCALYLATRSVRSAPRELVGDAAL